MQVLPCSEGRVRPDPGRSGKRHGHGAEDHARPGAGRLGRSIRYRRRHRLHINRDFQVNSQPTAACLTPAAALGGRAWPSFRPSSGPAGLLEMWEKALCVWLNSTLGLIGRWYVSNRQQQGRASLSVTAIGIIPVPDLRTIPRGRIVAAAKAFDDLIGEAMLPANEAYRDQARIELDERALRGLLGRPRDELDNLAVLPPTVVYEPSVHGGKKTRPLTTEAAWLETSKERAVR